MTRNLDIRTTVEQHVALWNAHDKDAWTALWRDAVTGEITMDDPVGTPPSTGWDAFLSPWDAYNALCDIAVEALVVNGPDAAALMRNTLATDGAPLVFPSIEIYRFNDDGSLEGRFYYDVPRAEPPHNASDAVRRDEIRNRMIRSHELWNAHDKDGWVALWRDAIAGDDCLLDDHATGEMHRGFDECRPDTWERFNKSISFDRRALMVCGDEAAMAVDNTVRIGDDTIVTTSIETYRFGADGSLYEQNWYEVAQP